MPGSDSSLQLVTFQLGSEKYGIDIMEVKEIVDYEEIREIHQQGGLRRPPVHFGEKRLENLARAPEDLEHLELGVADLVPGSVHRGVLLVRSSGVRAL